VTLTVGNWCFQFMIDGNEPGLNGLEEEWIEK
jgi:hypothetical protein